MKPLESMVTVSVFSDVKIDDLVKKEKKKERKKRSPKKEKKKRRKKERKKKDLQKKKNFISKNKNEKLTKTFLVEETPAEA
jgi:hypothetical protein